MYTCMYVCMYVYMYVCMYAYVCIHTVLCDLFSHGTDDVTDSKSALAATILSN